MTVCSAVQQGTGRLGTWQYNDRKLVIEVNRGCKSCSSPLLVRSWLLGDMCDQASATAGRSSCYEEGDAPKKSHTEVQRGRVALHC